MDGGLLGGVEVCFRQHERNGRYRLRRPWPRALLQARSDPALVRSTKPQAARAPRKGEGASVRPRPSHPRGLPPLPPSKKMPHAVVHPVRGRPPSTPRRRSARRPRSGQPVARGAKDVASQMHEARLRLARDALRSRASGCASGRACLDLLDHGGGLRLLGEEVLLDEEASLRRHVAEVVEVA